MAKPLPGGCRAGAQFAGWSGGRKEGLIRDCRKKLRLWSSSDNDESNVKNGVKKNAKQHKLRRKKPKSALHFVVCSLRLVLESSSNTHKKPLDYRTKHRVASMILYRGPSTIALLRV